VALAEEREAEAQQRRRRREQEEQEEEEAAEASRKRARRDGGDDDEGNEASAAVPAAPSCQAPARNRSISRCRRQRRPPQEEEDDGGLLVPVVGCGGRDGANDDDNDDAVVPEFDGCRRRLSSHNDEEEQKEEKEEQEQQQAVPTPPPQPSAPPPPPPPLLSGLRQRLLAHAFLRAAAGRPSEACPSLADFTRYAYSELSRAVVRRARLTGAPFELLLALGVEEAADGSGGGDNDNGADDDNGNTDDGVRWLARYDWRSARVRDLRYVGSDAALAQLLAAPEEALGLRAPGSGGTGDGGASPWQRAGAAVVRTVLREAAASWRLEARPRAERAALAAQLGVCVTGAAAPRLVPTPLIDPSYLMPRFARWEGGEAGGGAGQAAAAATASAAAADGAPMQLSLPFLLHETAAWFAESGGGRIVFEPVVAPAARRRRQQQQRRGGGGSAAAPFPSVAPFTLDLRPLLRRASPLATVGLLYHPHDPFVVAMAEQPPPGPIAPVEPPVPPPVLVWSVGGGGGGGGDGGGEEEWR